MVPDFFLKSGDLECEGRTCMLYFADLALVGGRSWCVITIGHDAGDGNNDFVWRLTPADIIDVISGHGYLPRTGVNADWILSQSANISSSVDGTQL